MCTAAYLIRLQAQAQIHNVFHVSLLKPSIGQNSVIAPSLPPIDEEGGPLIMPQQLLAKKMVKENNSAKVEYLVNWVVSLEEDATWEEAHYMLDKFPNLPFQYQLTSLNP